MIFNVANEKNGYSQCPFDDRFLIYRNYELHLLQLCLNSPDEEEVITISEIFIGDAGKLPNAHNLAWRTKEEFRNQGFAKQLLALYLEEITPEGVCFAVVIKKENTASLNLARSVGFKEYDQDLDKVYLKR